jgi:hypothetical protein
LVERSELRRVAAAIWVKLQRSATVGSPYFRRAGA